VLLLLLLLLVLLVELPYACLHAGGGGVQYKGCRLLLLTTTQTWHVLVGSDKAVTHQAMLCCVLQLHNCQGQTLRPQRVKRRGQPSPTGMLLPHRLHRS